MVQPISQAIGGISNPTQLDSRWSIHGQVRVEEIQLRSWIWGQSLKESWPHLKITSSYNTNCMGLCKRCVPYHSATTGSSEERYFGCPRNEMKSSRLVSNSVLTGSLASSGGLQGNHGPTPHPSNISRRKGKASGTWESTASDTHATCEDAWEGSTT